MRLTTEVDGALMARAMQVCGAKTKRETLERAVNLLVRLEQQKLMRAARGKLHWEGDLRKMRRSRFS